MEAGLTISYMDILSSLNLVLKGSVSLQAFSEQYMDAIKKDRLFESQNNFKVVTSTFEVMLK